MLKPILADDAQARPGYYLLPDDVFVQVVATGNGRTIAKRYWPDAPSAAAGPWVHTPGLSRALAHCEPMRPRDASAAARRLMAPVAA